MPPIIPQSLQPPQQPPTIQQQRQRQRQQQYPQQQQQINPQLKQIKEKLSSAKSYEDYFRLYATIPDNLKQYFTSPAEIRQSEGYKDYQTYQGYLQEQAEWKQAYELSAKESGMWLASLNPSVKAKLRKIWAGESAVGRAKRLYAKEIQSQLPAGENLILDSKGNIVGVESGELQQSISLKDFNKLITEPIPQQAEVQKPNFFGFEKQIDFQKLQTSVSPTGKVPLTAYERDVLASMGAEARKKQQPFYGLRQELQQQLSTGVGFGKKVIGKAGELSEAVTGRTFSFPLFSIATGGGGGELDLTPKVREFTEKLKEARPEEVEEITKEIQDEFSEKVGEKIYNKYQKSLDAGDINWNEAVNVYTTTPEYKKIQQQYENKISTELKDMGLTKAQLKTFLGEALDIIPETRGGVGLMVGSLYGGGYLAGRFGASTVAGVVASKPITTATSTLYEAVPSPLGKPTGFAKAVVFGAVAPPVVATAYGTEITKGLITSPAETGLQLFKYAVTKPEEIVGFGIGGGLRGYVGGRIQLSRQLIKDVKKLPPAQQKLFWERYNRASELQDVKVRVNEIDLSRLELLEKFPEAQQMLIKYLSENKNLIVGGSVARDTQLKGFSTKRVGDLDLYATGRLKRFEEANALKHVNNIAEILRQRGVNAVARKKTRTETIYISGKKTKVQLNSYKVLVDGKKLVEIHPYSTYLKANIEEVSPYWNIARQGLTETPSGIRVLKLGIQLKRKWIGGTLEEMRTGKRRLKDIPEAEATELFLTQRKEAQDFVGLVSGRKLGIMKDQQISGIMSFGVVETSTAKTKPIPQNTIFGGLAKVRKISEPSYYPRTPTRLSGYIFRALAQVSYPSYQVRQPRAKTYTPKTPASLIAPIVTYQSKTKETTYPTTLFKTPTKPIRDPTQKPYYPAIAPPKQLPSFKFDYGGFTFPDEEQPPKKRKGGGIMKLPREREEPYDTFVLQHGSKPRYRQWVQIADNVPRMTALSIGANYVDENLPASFKIVRDEGKYTNPLIDDSWKFVKHKFRDWIYRTEKDTGRRKRYPTQNKFIEKAKHRLDSSGEVTQIHGARVRALFGMPDRHAPQKRKGGKRRRFTI